MPLATKPVSLDSEGNSAMKCFDSFVHDGFVSLSNDKSKAVPVRILRDTGASQSLLLGNTLPFSETSFTGSNALIKGINCDDFASVPLHRVQLFSDLVCGEVKVGLQDSLPFEGVQFLLGNDLAGNKVYAHPIVTEKSSYELQNNAVNSDKVFPSCAVTQTMKESSDVKAVPRSFEVGQKVIVLLLAVGNTLQARYSGPYVVRKKLSELNYVVITPDRRKKSQLCHVNMLKTYVERNETFAVQLVAVEVSESHAEVSESDESERDSLEVNYPTKLTNSEALLNLDTNLSHLTLTQQQDLKEVIHKFEHLFSDVPSKTILMHYDVDVGDSPPIRQHPYRLNPIKEIFGKGNRIPTGKRFH